MRKKQIVEYETLDRIYKFEDKQMKSINETRQYYRNAYLREIGNCVFHAQAILQSQSLYKYWPKSKQKQNKNKKQKTKQN
jgi:hypothetical protein